jgi:hypothetical protein
MASTSGELKEIKYELRLLRLCKESELSQEAVSRYNHGIKVDEELRDYLELLHETSH